MAEELHHIHPAAQVVPDVCARGARLEGPGVGQAEGGSEGGSLSPLGPRLPALGHPGWKHSLTWAGPTRRWAGGQAQNLPECLMDTAPPSKGH